MDLKSGPRWAGGQKERMETSEMGDRRKGKITGRVRTGLDEEISRGVS